MNRLLRRDKGESVILGYVLLLVLAIGMAGAVYAYLKVYVPKDRLSCPEGTGLVIEQVICDSVREQINITLVNQGLFSVDGSYIKAGKAERVARTMINCPGPGQLPPECQLYFTTGSPLYTLKPLEPGQRWSGTFAYDDSSDRGMHEIEIEPLIVDEKNNRIQCTDAIITKTITC